MDINEIKTSIGKILENLYESNVIANRVNFSADTALLGDKSELDSLAFVTLIADMEDFLLEKFNREITIDLNKIQDFSAENPSITVEKMAQYLSQLING